nr:quinoprotein glucose dehydrogenase [Saprospiraceae bacterium]
MFKKKFPNFFTASCFAVTAILTLFGCGSGGDSQAQSSWTHYSGSPEQSKFFPTTEITKENVGQLEVAWMYPSGDDFSYYFNPIVVDTT